MSKFVFFTLNHFFYDDGGTVRMRGIINALANNGQHVILLSNTKSYKNFHPSVKHIYLNKKISKNKGRIFQFLLSLLPIYVVKIIFKNFLIDFEKVIKNNKLSNQNIVSFEYIDNSIAYFLKKQNIIHNYISDTHGIAPLEFLYKKNKNLLEEVISFFKYKISLKLDSKVITAAKKKIFVSKLMKNYFERRYPSIRQNNNIIVRDGISEDVCRKKPKINFVKKLKKQFNILSNDFVILFAGTFKDMGGIIDLLKAFHILANNERNRNIKLLLLGDGERFKDAQVFVKKFFLKEKVIFTGKVDYNDLKNYQELANLIVCPDIKHPYSELVPHIKYFDSLASGKVVINGAFASIKEINVNEKFSINFIPSNVKDLANKIKKVMNNFEFYKKKYRNNKKFICSQFTYNKFSKQLTNIIQ